MEDKPLDIQYLLQYNPTTNNTSDSDSTMKTTTTINNNTNTLRSSTSINTTKSTNIFSRMLSNHSSTSNQSSNNRLKKPHYKHIKGIYNTYPVDIHTLVSLVTVSPHIALIVDAPVTLKPGVELLTIAVGPQLASKFSAVDNNPNPSSASSAKKPPAGCPIAIQTDQHVKFLAQVW